MGVAATKVLAWEGLSHILLHVYKSRKLALWACGSSCLRLSGSVKGQFLRSLVSCQGFRRGEDPLKD